MTTTFLDRVRMNVASAPGTGSVALGAAISGYQSFSAAGVTNGATVSYAIEDGANWEIGHGTYSTTGPTVARTTILGSSNAGAAITASSSAIIYATYLAEDIGGSGSTPWDFSPPTASMFTTNVDDGTHLTLTDDANVGLLVSTPMSNNTQYVRSSLKAVTPTGNWYAIAKVKYTVPPFNYCGAGIVVFNSSENKPRMFGILNQQNQFVISYYAGGGYNSTNYGNGTNGNLISEWMKIAFDGTNIGFFASGDGKIWSLLYADTPSNVFGTGNNIDHIGFGVLVGSTGGETVGVSCPYWLTSGL